MEFNELFSKLNDGKLAPPADKRLWEEASDRISVHAKGILPRFENVRKRGTIGSFYEPAAYREKYQYIFDNVILNRHPNEQEQHYEFRKSVYSPIAQEIYLKGKIQVSGSIFQQSQYTIEATDDNGQAYLDSIDFEQRVKEEFFEHILTDPYGKFAVIERHWTEFGSDEKAEPDIEIVQSCNIMHYHPRESILFRSAYEYEGRKVLYFLDRNFCIRLVQTAKGRKAYDLLSAYEHGLGELPVVNIDKYLFKPYVTWADQVARNFSDDEIVAKNNNYPHIQMVESICNECLGSKFKAYPCDNCEGGYGEEENCHTCKGRGTISVNPGEIHVIKESEFRPGELQGGSGMVDRIKFINPDVAVSKNALERAQWSYEMCLKSLHLAFIQEAQSGVAKEVDRDQLNLLISNCAEVIFGCADKMLRYLFGYLNMGITEVRPYIVERPTQYKLKTEWDVQEELLKLNNADISVRRQKNDEYMQIKLAGNAVELKKWNIVKVWDYLYCMNESEITTNKLSGSITVEQMIKHTHIEVMLNNIILDKSEDWFINATEKEIIALLDTNITAYTPVDPMQPTVQERVVVEA